MFQPLRQAMLQLRRRVVFTHGLLAGLDESADGARARTGADGAVALNLPRADGQLIRAGQHYYSHLNLRPPSKDFDYNQPLIREGPNDYILLTGRRSLCAPCRAESTG